MVFSLQISLISWLNGTMALTAGFMVMNCPCLGVFQIILHPLYETLKNDSSVTFTERSTYSKSTLATSKHPITRDQGTGIKVKAENIVKHQWISLHKALLPPDVFPISRQTVPCLQTEFSDVHLRETNIAGTKSCYLWLSLCKSTLQWKTGHMKFQKCKLYLGRIWSTRSRAELLTKRAFSESVSRKPSNNPPVAFSAIANPASFSLAI